jgi:hypothetical protein
VRSAIYNLALNGGTNRTYGKMRYDQSRQDDPQQSRWIT